MRSIPIFELSTESGYHSAHIRYCHAVQIGELDKQAIESFVEDDILASIESGAINGEKNLSTAYGEIVVKWTPHPNNGRFQKISGYLLTSNLASSSQGHEETISSFPASAPTSSRQSAIPSETVTEDSENSPSSVINPLTSNLKSASLHELIFEVIQRCAPSYGADQLLADQIIEELRTRVSIDENHSSNVLFFHLLLRIIAVENTPDSLMKELVQALIGNSDKQNKVIREFFSKVDFHSTPSS